VGTAESVGGAQALAARDHKLRRFKKRAVPSGFLTGEKVLFAPVRLKGRTTRLSWIPNPKRGG
jgi:hypothetical protein